VGFWDKFRKVAEPAAKVAQVIAPQTPAGQVASIVEKIIADPSDPKNVDALRVLAKQLEALELRVTMLEAFARKPQPFSPESPVGKQ
jgi:hypothetical protein